MNNFLKPLVIWLGIVFIALLLWLVIPAAVWRYAFYLRVPILLGALLIALPILAVTWLRAMLRNLFVLRGPWQMAFVVISAIMAGTAVMLGGNIILRNAPARFGVPPWDLLPAFWQADFLKYALAVGLSLPVCVTATVLSKERIGFSADANILREKPQGGGRWTGALLGAAVGLGLLFVIDRLEQWLNQQVGLNQFLLTLLSALSKQQTQGYIVDGKLAPGQATALTFFLVGLGFYLVIARLFRPKPIAGRPEAPALLYVMFLIAIASLFFSSLTFFFDYYQILPLLLFLGGSAASYALFKVDHFFELELIPRKPQETGGKLSDFATVLNQRLQHQPPDQKTLVVVCASGGGIQAAGWTVAVLNGLQQFLGPGFTQATGLISSASGGSVGTMYFLDRFNLQTGYPDPDALEKIFYSATSDSLDAVGWGLTYPDLSRLVGLPFLADNLFGNPLCDRGRAIETDWKGELKHPNLSLEDWRTQVLQGQIPIPVFNATLVEDGRRFLISPLTFAPSTTTPLPPQLPLLTQQKFVDCNTLFGDATKLPNFSAATASRLSATFPYISPICRCSLNLPGKTYHVADGGFFDNSGIFTVVEWLDHLLASNTMPDLKRILVLQINAFPKSLPGTQADASDLSQRGWAMALLGPLLTLFRVRDSTQTARNEAELQLLCQRWQKDPNSNVEIKHVPIFFPSSEEMESMKQEFAPNMQRSYFFNEDGKYDPPLSWKLTNAEKKAILRAWQFIACDRHPDSLALRLHQLWEDWGMNPPDLQSFDQAHCSK